MRIWGMMVALLLGAAATVQAAPLNLKQIPDDAKWLAHADVDAMRQSTVVQRFYDECLAKLKDAEKHFGKARERIGMDPRTDLHGVTLYGTKICKDEGVMIVHANVDKEGLLRKAEKAPNHEVVEHGDHQIHTWTHRKGKHDRKVAGAFFGDDVLVFSSSVDQLKKALDVLGGKATSLEGKDVPLAQATPPGTLFAARAVDLAKAEAPCKSPLVTKSQRFSFAKGEHAGQWFVDGTLVTDSPEIAQQVKDVVEGLRAMALLHHGKDEATRKLFNRLQVSVDGTTVNLTFRAPAAAVADKVDKMCEEMAKMHKKHREKHEKAKQRKLEEREL